MQVNPFVKFRGLELFGVLERAEGRAAAEAVARSFNQFALDTVYRFFQDEKLFVGARYNRVDGNLVGIVERRGRESLANRCGLVRDSRVAGQRRVRRSEVRRVSARRTSRTADGSRARCSRAWSPSSGDGGQRVCHDPAT